jgi:hypothetical protein
MNQAEQKQQAKPIEQAQLVTLLGLNLVDAFRLVETQEGVFELQVLDTQGNALVLATKRASSAARQFKKAEAAFGFIKSHWNRSVPPQITVLLRTAT